MHRRTLEGEGCAVQLMSSSGSTSSQTYVEGWHGLWATYYDDGCARQQQHHLDPCAHLSPSATLRVPTRSHLGDNIGSVLFVCGAVPPAPPATATCDATCSGYTCDDWFDWGWSCSHNEAYYSCAHRPRLRLVLDPLALPLHATAFPSSRRRRGSSCCWKKRWWLRRRS